MKKVLLGTAMCACLLMAGMASAQLTAIDTIQTYNPITGAPIPFPVLGSTVTVEGTIFVAKGSFNTGSQYIQAADGGIQIFNYTTMGALGDSIQVTGTVKNQFGEIELDPVSTFSLISHPGEPAPIVKTVSQLVHWTGAPPRVYDYESVGRFLRVTGTVATAPTSYVLTDNKQFSIAAGGDTLIIYVSKNTGIDVTGVAIGDLYQIDGACVKYNALAELKPRFQTDMVENPASPAPAIENVTSSNYHPLSTTALTISADITSGGGTISSATLYWRNSAGDSLGAYTAAAMTLGTPPSYSGVIPTPHSGIRVDYYVSATDNVAQTTLSPATAPTSHNELAVGFTTIYNMQYVDPNAVSQSSPYRYKVVNLEGIVTYSTGEAGAISKFIMQTATGGPFSGALVYDGTGTYGAVYTGDRVQVGGRIDEYLGCTEVLPFRKPDAVVAGSVGAPVTVLSYSNPLPAAMRVATKVLGDRVLTDGNGYLGEAYETCRVRTWTSLVLAAPPLPSRRFTITDTGVLADSVRVIPLIDLTYPHTAGDHVVVEGWMDDNGTYMLRPVRDEDIVFGITGAGDTTPQLLPAGGFVGVSPNPFNPLTELEFVLTRPNLAQLNIYNLRGQMVRSLANGHLEAGAYTLVWDGTDDAGSHMGSGTYFARLRIGAEVMQVQKLTLVK
jgi:hypothetical protein